MPGCEQKKYCVALRTVFSKVCFKLLRLAESRAELFRHYLYSLQALLPLFDFEGYLLTVAQTLKPV